MMLSLPDIHAKHGMLNQIKSLCWGPDVRIHQSKGFDFQALGQAAKSNDLKM